MHQVQKKERISLLLPSSFFLLFLLLLFFSFLLVFFISQLVLLSTSHSVIPLESPTIEVIGDLVHVHPLALRLAIETRGDEMAIITDAIMDVSSLGTSNYAGNEIEVQVIPPPTSSSSTSVDSAPTPPTSASGPDDSCSSSSSCSSSLPRGKVVIKGTNTIAGSCTNLLRIFNDLIRILGISVERALKMLTLNPARIAKIEGEVGTLEKGKKADFLLFDRRLNLVGVYIDGRRIKLS
jgi:hypothetical protein